MPAGKLQARAEELNVASSLFVRADGDLQAARRDPRTSHSVPLTRGTLQLLVLVLVLLLVRLFTRTFDLCAARLYLISASDELLLRCTRTRTLSNSNWNTMRFIGQLSPALFNELIAATFPLLLEFN